MDGALSWISAIAEWVGKFFPRWMVVDVTTRGVKFVKGSRIVTFGPGIVWWWPATTNIHTYPVVRQADDLRSQTIVTVDNKVVIVGGMIVYTVDNIEALLAHTHQPESTIADISLTAIHDVCCKLTWEDLKAEQRKGTLDTKLKNAAQKELASYGVKVLKTMLTDLAPGAVIKLVQSTSQDT